MCGEPLFYKKGSRTVSGYEIAHIYPLNPSAAEVLELEDLERLSSDLNDADNLIPLCPTCHGKFDKPRTAAEYLRLLERKKACIEEDAIKATRKDADLREEIGSVLAAIAGGNDQSVSDLVMDPKPLSDKLESGVPPLLKRKVTRNVTDYYHAVRTQFEALEDASPGVSDLIFHQARGLYLRLKLQQASKEQIINAVSVWLKDGVAGGASIEAAEVIAAYFIQNCEVLE